VGTGEEEGEDMPASSEAGVVVEGLGATASG
jgi:hypothetical protein